jgi:ferric-dicitrate binding protein FerR (iron transport regulator)
MSKDVLEQNVETLIESGGEPPRISDSARTRIRAELVHKFGVIEPRRSPLRAVAIGLAATVAFVLLLGRFIGRDPLPPQSQTLADGSTFVAQPGAKVVVVGPRHVRVEGAALLDVARGKGAFVVDTARGRIEVLGTRFLVDGEAERTLTAVVRGEVKLVSDLGSVVLHAGDQGIAEPGHPPTRSAAPRLSSLVSWARDAREKAENAPAVHHGTLFARDPGVHSHPPWGQEYPLPLKQLTVDVEVEDQVARVALDQTFHNDQPQELEGVYRFAIPPDAALQRLAMYVDGHLEESAVVERMKARRIYEELVYRRVDPALLEWAGNGRLDLRVYPLRALQDKRLMLAYTQSLPRLYDDYSLTIPLPEIDQPIGNLDVAVHVKGCASCELSSTSHQITVERTGDDATVHVHQKNAEAGDFVLRVRDPRKAAMVATHTESDGRYLLVRAPADLGGKPSEYRPRTWVVLDDVSASRQSTDLRAQMDVIDALAKELDENDKLAVVAFDVEARTKLPPTRVLDIDRRALRESLKGEGGIGATDFAAALDAAVKLAGDGGNIIYLGDGVVTSGPRTLDTLRAQLGRTHFIGVGIGDGPDTQTLDALAAASGGYATTIDLSDDLAWRTFDLVSALHTQRVTALEARLVDAAGAPVAATAYLASPQLADGEEIDLVAKLASAGTPAAIELTGSLDGAAWRKRVDLTAGHDAGYLPRMWAQRHIAARLLAKHEPAPPCAGEPCATEDQRREDRDELIRREVVALGKKYFLLSRHTSLLVLENDDMYKQYDVTKGSGDTWAPYAMPAAIPVVTTASTAPSNVDDDAEVLRPPLQVFYNDDYRNAERSIEQQMVTNADLGGDLALRYPTGAFADQEVGDATTGVGWGDGKSGWVTLAQGDKTRELPPAEASEHGRDIVVAGEAGRYSGPMPVTTTRSSMDFRSIVSNGGTSWLSPMHFTYPAEVAFDDVSAFVPALVVDRFAQLRAELGKPAAHTLDPAAKTLLDRARTQLRAGTYQWGAFAMTVDEHRHVTWTRTTDTGLVEAASYDGVTWKRRYAELDLEVDRALGSDDLALGLAYLPIWIADPAHYAQYFDVIAKGNDVLLGSSYVLRFDDQARLVQVRDASGSVLVSVTWNAAGPAAARAWGEELTVGYGALRSSDPTLGPALVTVTLPSHLPAYWTSQLAKLPEGSPAWRAAQRQRIVAAAAASDRFTAYAAYEALRTHGGVELGDLVLASGGVATATTDDQQATALSSLRDEPLARYLAASRAFGKSPRPELLAPFLTGGLVGNLWALRAAVAELSVSHGKAAVDRLSSITGVELRVYGAVAAAAHYDLPAEELERAWKTVETGPYVNIARAQAALALYNRGENDRAAEELTALVNGLDLDAPPAQLQQAPSLFASSRRGNAGWAIVWATWRDKVLAGTSYDHVVSLIPLAAQWPEDLQRVLTRAAELAGDDVGAKLSLAQLAVSYGQAAWADAMIAPLLKTQPSRPLYQLAAQIALAQGRTAGALGDLEAAQDAPGDATVDANTLRAEMAQLIGVARQLALASSGAARDAAVTKALHWGDRWRQVDPGNAQIDEQLGTLLLAVGDTQGAWRQLSGTIERDPWSGTGYMTVADAFERQGQVLAALPFWQQAIVIDQTNPTPLLRKAQALIALGRTAEGDALLKNITTHKWHDIWSSVVYQANNMVNAGRARR